MTLDAKALEALKNNQRQLDMDGVEVGVSRQALEELIAAYEALSRQQEEAVPVAWIVTRNGKMYLPLLRSPEEADRYRQRNPDEVLQPLYASTVPADAGEPRPSFLSADDGEFNGNAQPEALDDGLTKAIAFVRKRLDDYVAEHGMYDPETGATEFPGNGDETVCEWEEIIDGLEALRGAKP